MKRYIVLLSVLLLFSGLRPEAMKINKNRLKAGRVNAPPAVFLCAQIQTSEEAQEDQPRQQQKTDAGKIKLDPLRL